MTHLLHLLPAAAASLLRARRPQPPLPYPPSRALSAQWHYQPPEPGVPAPRWVPIPGSCPLAYELEERRDCQHCGGVWAARVRTDGFKCQRCQTVIYT